MLETLIFVDYVVSFFNKKLLCNQRLKQRIRKYLDFAQKNKTYKGLRNKYKLPSRGQRTKTNGKTKKKFKI